MFLAFFSEGNIWEEMSGEGNVLDPTALAMPWFKNVYKILIPGKTTN